MKPLARRWEDQELVLISALEHWSYCPRQCALIHLEQTFDENLYTLRGRLLHKRVDAGGAACDHATRVERGLPLWSTRLGIVGKADVVEFYGETPYPVEFKHGRRRKGIHPELQLCAQALCLEEMLGQRVPTGAIFHHGSRRRREVVFSLALRHLVEVNVEQVRQMLARKVLPPAVNDSRCRLCSLSDSCMPAVVSESNRLRRASAALYRVETLRSTGER